MKTRRCLFHFRVLAVIALAMAGSSSAVAAVAPLSFTVNLSEPVTVNTTGGTPTIAVDVGGVSRTATYSSGSGSTALTFTYTPTLGDIDLDGITVSSPIQLNGGTLKDAAGNNATLTFTPPNTSGVKIDYPSLSMDFVYDADGRYTLNGTAYNDLASFLSATGGTFSRASTASYVDSSGTLQTAASGAPRFDYDPITHTAKGLLIEESRTNLFKGSAELTSNKLNGAVTLSNNVAIAPDGTMTADRFSATSTYSGYWTPSTVVTISGSTQYTTSLYIKRESGGTTIRMGTANQFSNGAGDWYVIFDFATNTFTYIDSHFSNVSYKDVGNGWFRFSYTATSAAGGYGGTPLIYTNTSTMTWLVWGIQVEQAATASSYIPTTTTEATRAADILTVPMQPAMGVSNGTAVIDANLGKGAFQLTGVTSWLDIIGADNLGIGGFARNSANNIILGPSLTNKSKLAVAYGSGKSYTVADGGTVNSANGIPDFSSGSTLHLGTRFDASGAFINDTIRKFKYYPLQAADTQLQLLTQ